MATNSMFQRDGFALVSESAEPVQTGLDFGMSLAEIRPEKIENFIGLTKIKLALRKLADSPRSINLLFEGAPGTGKSSMGIALGNCLAGGCETHHIPSGQAKADYLQEVLFPILHRIPYDWTQGRAVKWHLVLIDESDALSTQAIALLLSRMDGTNPAPNTLFVLTTNFPEKLPDALLSRVLRFKFTSYGAGEEIKQFLAHLWQERANGAPAPDWSRVPTSDFRSAINWLESELLLA